MPEAPRLITAAELDRMTPNERAAALVERTVTDLDELPESFRRRIIETATRLARGLDDERSD